MSRRTCWCFSRPARWITRRRIRRLPHRSGCWRFGWVATRFIRWKCTRSGSWRCGWVTTRFIRWRCTRYIGRYMRWHTRCGNSRRETRHITWQFVHKRFKCGSGECTIRTALQRRCKRALVGFKCRLAMIVQCSSAVDLHLAVAVVVIKHCLNNPFEQRNLLLLLLL